MIKFQIYGLIKKDNKNSSWKEEEDSILSQIVMYNIFKIEPKITMDKFNGVTLLNNFLPRRRKNILEMPNNVGSVG